MDTYDDTCGAQWTQEHNGQELSVTFLSHTFMDTQQKWSTSKQEAYGIYNTIIKWNYYPQGSNIIVYNDHKSLQMFLIGKNVNNRVNQWSLELATYNITFRSGALNKAADSLSSLVEIPNNTPATSILINSAAASQQMDPLLTLIAKQKHY